MTDVVVVGAGIVGAAVARELAVRGVAVTLLDRGAVSSGTTGLGEGNVLCSDKDAGPELELARAGLGAVRRARGAARRRGADPPQGRADRAPGGRRPGPASPRGSRGSAIPEARLLDAGRGARAGAGADRRRAAARASSRTTCSAIRGAIARALVARGRRGRRRRCARAARSTRSCRAARRAYCGTASGSTADAVVLAAGPWSRGARRRRRARAAARAAQGPARPARRARGRAWSATRSSTAPTCARSRSAGSGLEVTHGRRDDVGGRRARRLVPRAARLRHVASTPPSARRWSRAPRGCSRALRGAAGGGRVGGAAAVAARPPPGDRAVARGAGALARDRPRGRGRRARAGHRAARRAAVRAARRRWSTRRRSTPTGSEGPELRH